MLYLVVREGLLGSGAVVERRIDWCGQTAGQIAAQCRTHVPDGCDIVVAVDGRTVDGDRMEDVIPDGSSVLVSGVPHGLEITGVALVDWLIGVIAAAAVSYGIGQLIGRPKPPNVPQQRGDAQSGTYNWDGMRTAYGQGLLVPFVYGEHWVPGQVVSIGAGPSETRSTSHVVALSEGRIESICDVTGGEPGEADDVALPLTNKPRVNGRIVPSPARITVRLGEIAQSVSPIVSSGQQAIDLPDYPIINAANQIEGNATYQYDGTAPIRRATAIVAFPYGVFGVDQAGGSVAVTMRFRLLWAPIDQPLSLTLFHEETSGLLRVDSYARAVTGTFPAEMSGPFFVRVEVAWLIGTFVQTELRCQWSRVRFEVAGAFALPRIAWASLHNLFDQYVEFAAGNADFAFPVRGLRVRVWDASLGWSPSTWHVPAAPFNFHTNPPGRNPAWIFAHLCLARWGGKPHGMTDANLDLPALRRWALWCDSNPGTVGSLWNEARHCCDFVADEPRRLWEWLLLVAQAGGAVPFRRGNVVSVHYQYRDAHADALVSVPAKDAVQLFTDGNVEGLRVRFFDRRRRPTVVTYQFLDAANGYAQAAVPFPDFEIEDDPANPSAESYHAEVVQAYGITRRTQLTRDSFVYHRTNRLVTHEVEFVCGPYALAATIGNLVDVAHSLLVRHYPDVGASVQVVGVPSATAIWVDHAIAGSGLEFVARGPDGVPVKRSVTAVAAVPGHPEWTELQFASAATIDEGAPAVVGKVGKLVLRYQVVDITLEDEMRRRVRAVEWIPKVYDEVPASVFEAAPDPGDGIGDPESPNLESLASAVSPLLRMLPDRSLVLSWATDPQAIRPPAWRVFRRFDDADAWDFLAETSGNSIPVAAAPFAVLHLSIVGSDARGLFAVAGPDSGTLATFTVPEFPDDSPPDAHGTATATDGAGALLVTWNECAGVEEWEARVGSSWPAARVVYRGDAAACRFDVAPFDATTPLLIAARSVAGVYSLRPATITTTWAPPGRAQKFGRSDVSASPAGTLTGLAVEASAVGLVPGPSVKITAERTGTWEMSELDLGFSAAWLLRFVLDSFEVETIAASELTDAIASGEARWRTPLTRPASVAAPGADFYRMPADVPGAASDVPADLLGHGYRGEANEHTAVVIESRTRAGGVWSAWSRHRDGVVVCDRVQVRVALWRRDARYQRHVTRCYLSAFI